MADRYIKGQMLGKGSFGAAYLVTCKADGQKYVLKEIDISRMQRSEREGAEQEAKVLQALHHPNVVSCKEAFVTGGKLCILMDYCSEGDLANALKKRNGAVLPEAVLLDWFVQLCLGLKHVHDRKILHRDIKTQNVFMSAGGLLKLGDFGVSKVLSSTMQLAKTGVGTPYYLSPEICQNRGYNAKSDVWSLGCVLYEMATLRHPFDAPNMRQLATKIVRGSYLPIASSYSKGLKDLVDMTLRTDPKRRPTVNEVLKTPVLQERIAKFLSATVRAAEFSHTVIHKAGVGLSKAPLPSGAAAAAGAAGRASPLGPIPAGAVGGPRPAPGLPAGGAVRPRAALSPPPSAAARPPAAAPARAAPKAPASKWSPRPPGPTPSGGPARASRPSNDIPQVPPSTRLSPRQLPPGNRLSPRPSNDGGRISPGGRVSPIGGRVSPIGGRVSPVGASNYPSAAKVVADAHAAQVQRQKALAAQQAQRQQARAQLEEEKRRLALEAKQLEEARLKLAREQKKRQDMDSAGRLAAQRKAAEQAVRQQAEADMKQKKADRQSRDTEREKERESMRAAKQEWQQRQMEAFRNRRQVEGERAEPAPLPFPLDSPPVYAPAPRRPSQGQLAGAAPVPSAPRQLAARPVSGEHRYSQPLESRPAARPGVGLEGGQQGAGPTAEERRQIYNEMKQAAERNRRAVRGDYDTPQPAAPGPARPSEEGHMSPAAPSPALSREPSPSPWQPSGGLGVDPTAEERRQIWEEMRAAAERNRQQITGQPPRSRPPSRPSSRPPSPPRSQPASCPASRPQSPPHSRPPSRPASRPTSRPHSPPSLDPIQAVHKPSAAPSRQGLPPRAQPGPALASGRALVHDQPTAVSAANAVARAAAVQVPAQQGQHAKQPDADQGHAPALPSALQQASPQPVRTPVSAPQIGAVSQQPMRQQPLQQPASPGGQEMLHQVEFVIPGAAHRDGLIPSQKVAELQTAGQENGSGGSLEGVSELQPIPRLSPRDGAAADEEAEYGQMVEEMQQVLNADDASSASDDSDFGDKSLAGKFMLNGEEIDLGVGPQASMAHRVEALRVLLEQRLGFDTFMKVYRRLESIPTSHDEEEEKVAAELAELLGPERMPWLQLVYQLIVSEEAMQAEQ
ncbi:TPA: hypothetical protein ACH3X3_009975 [Trebouxia sp. C0006]